MKIKKNAVIVTITPYTDKADAYLGDDVDHYPEQTVESWHDMRTLVIAQEADTLAGNIQAAIGRLRHLEGIHAWKAIRAVRDLANDRARMAPYHDPGCDADIEVEEGEDGHYSLLIGGLV